MPARVRKYLDQQVILITLTATGINPFGEQIFQETVASGAGYIHFTDRLVETDVGVVPVSQVELWTDPRELTPTVSSTATVAGKTYEIQDVKPRFQRGINLVDVSNLQEKSQ